ncbi:MAG: large conductance mechanosensitive channel protein MscL [Firmicutes bacterium]|nr:large conductance mechanosensitive channel protein MscL [Bacillota bacterium]
MKKWFSEFKAFISKGNAIDMAVGIVVGSAFNAIIKSFVGDIIMPLLSLIVKSDITKLYLVLRGSATYDSVLGTLILSEDAVLLKYGAFIQTILDFLIIAFAIFLALKVVVGMQKKLEQLKEAIITPAEKQ